MVLRLCLAVLVTERGERVSGEIRLLGSELGDRIDEGDVTCSLLRRKLPFEEIVELHWPSGDILFGSHKIST